MRGGYGTILAFLISEYFRDSRVYKVIVLFVWFSGKKLWPFQVLELEMCWFCGVEC